MFKNTKTLNIVQTILNTGILTILKVTNYFNYFTNYFTIWNKLLANYSNYFENKLTTSISLITNYFKCFVKYY